MVWNRSKWQGKCDFASQGDMEVGRSSALVVEEVLQRGLELSENTLGVK